MTHVNRVLMDKAMDHIDHALGRPCDPLAPTRRNHFAIDDPEGFAGSPYWKVIARQGDMIFFAVTDEGRSALKAHLKEIGDKYREYIITYCGEELTPRAAKSHGQARYHAWLSVSDAITGLTFGEFQRHSSVCLANPKRATA